MGSAVGNALVEDRPDRGVHEGVTHELETLSLPHGALPEQLGPSGIGQRGQRDIKIGLADGFEDGVLDGLV